MSLAQEEDWQNYLHFNDFFTRELKPEARPIATEQSELVCPVDGSISQVGNIHEEQIFQAKGHQYSLAALLGGANEQSAKFVNGHFATLYLSPKDYHRIHMPITGTLRELIYVPGRLFSVNPNTTRAVPGLFARNERIISLFDTEAGSMALIMVGAMCVACMETVWQGVIALGAGNRIRRWNYEQDIQLQRGKEMGRFNMGSTVILLFEPRRIAWEPSLTEGGTVQMGQSLGKIYQPSA